MIIQLKPNQIFVFGSNRNGYHGGGAAKQALESFGAVWGQGIGLEGQSYAIPTLGYDMEKLPLEVIKISLEELASFAENNSDKEFLLTKIGTGIAGFTEEEMEPIMPVFPSNVIRV